MKKIFFNIFLIVLVIPITVSCYSLENEQYVELSPISINDVSSIIDVMTGEELVYDRLEVTSELPVTYEWAYGQKKTTSATSEYDMQSMEVISDKPDIQYTFTRIGQYILRLKVDNGESIEFKYFTLNVNSGVDEGLLILNNDDAGNGALTFIKKRTEDEVAADAQEIWDDIFLTLNPESTPLSNVTDMFMSDHTTSGIQYSQLLISTNDDLGRIYTLNPKTLELTKINPMKQEFGTWCDGISGVMSQGATYNYVYLRGGDKEVYRYDMFGDFIGERAGAETVGGAERNKTLVYSKRVPAMYNETTIFRIYNANVYACTVAGYRVINFCADRNSSKTYVIFQSINNPNSYSIKSIGSGMSSSISKPTDVRDFNTDNLTMDENSVLVGSLNSSDIYYTYNNCVYRWGLTTAPASSPVIALPEGEEICDMATNYMDDYGDGTEETLLYIATYNPSRASRLMYKYRIS